MRKFLEKFLNLLAGSQFILRSSLFQSAEFSWWDTLRPAEMSAVMIWSGVSRLWTYLVPQEAVPPGFNPLWRAYIYRLELEASPFLGECRRGPRHFRECQERLGYGPASGPTLQKACATLSRLVGWSTNSAGISYKMLKLEYIRLMGIENVDYVFTKIYIYEVHTISFETFFV